MKGKYPRQSLAKVCDVFGKSRQAYYAYEKQLEKDALDCDLIAGLILEERKLQPKIGIRKLYHMYKSQFDEHGLKVGRDKLFDVLRDYGLLVKRKKRYAVTTNSKHWMKKYTNLISDLTVDGPNQVWVSDITYLRVGDGFSYLSLITDLYSHLIVGYHCSQSLETKGSIIALKMAIKGAKGRTGTLIHHSDRGIQYCSHEYTGLLAKEGISISMGEVGNPYENAVAERVNGILKSEFLLSETFKNHGEAEKHAARSIKTYNERRPHGSCNNLTPLQAHSQEGVLKKTWKNYRKSSTLPSDAPAIENTSVCI